MVEELKGVGCFFVVGIFVIGRFCVRIIWIWSGLFVIEWLYVINKYLLWSWWFIVVLVWSVFKGDVNCI